MLDIPTHEGEMEVGGGRSEPDPFSPLGARGIGEPSQGAGSGAVLVRDRRCPRVTRRGWLSSYRTPIMTDMILTKLEGLAEPHSRLATHT